MKEVFEPEIKRTIAFVDGQNLYYAAREAFGYTYPNYDVLKLSTSICRLKGLHLVQTRFYTGIPKIQDNSRWHKFWAAKTRRMKANGIVVFTRHLRYRSKTVRLPNGSLKEVSRGEEKGIDVRIAIDIIRSAFRDEFDAALIFSQDQDLSEVVDEIKRISRERKRWITVYSAFPFSEHSKNRRGINRTTWIHITKDIYDACIDREIRPIPGYPMELL